MAESGFDRTETATPRRREEARSEGNVARSTDLTAASTLLAAIVLLYALGLKVFSGLKVIVEAMLGSELVANPTRADDAGTMLWYGGRMAAATAAPLILCLTAVGLLVTVGQVGLRFTPQAIQPKLSKLSPVKGLGNLFNLRAAIRLIMSLAKVAIVAALAAWVVLADLPRIILLSELDAMPLFGSACQMVYSLALKLAALLVVLAVIDYAYQIYQREIDLRMTKQEIKDEMKRMEGDPLIKQRRARVARQLAMQRIGAAVPQADVIVTNPTHYAIALRYDATMRAPKVIAKGADFLAMRIRQLAALHGVPVVERKELAQALYRNVEVGQEVPPEFYNTVAEILAYVYRLSGRKTA
ncbi:MAG: EscU/YscU/HrcU family type III secretion system export apparatus switch protein [Phycisphaeraceae bacterium]